MKLPIYLEPLPGCPCPDRSGQSCGPQTDCTVCRREPADGLFNDAPVCLGCAERLAA